MIEWYWLILTVISGIVIGVLLNDYIEEPVTSSFAFVICIITFIPICIYQMFIRFTLYPVDVETFERMKSISKDKKGKTKYKQLFGNFYIWFDWKASKIQNKIFLVKLKNKIEV